jgi:hypothetical protein
MKIITLFSIVLFFTNCLLAQITFEYEHLMQPNLLYTTHIDTNPNPSWVLTPPSSEPQVWDFTNMYDIDSTSNFMYSVPEGLTGYEFFPNATLGEEQAPGEFGDLFWKFWEHQETGLHFSGIYSEIPIFGVIAQSHWTGWIQFPTPFTYGDVLNNPVVNDNISIATFPELYVSRTVNFTNYFYESDSWGTIHTPAYPEGVEVIRTTWHFGSTWIDSVYTDPTKTGQGPWVFEDSDVINDFEMESLQYFFLQPNSDVPVVATLQVDPNSGQVLSATYAENNDVTNVDERHMNQLQLFPNPVTNNQLNITLPNTEISQLRVLDLTGRMVHAQAVLSDDRLQFNTHSFPYGLLLIQLLDETGSIMATGKFVNQK